MGGGRAMPCIIVGEMERTGGDSGHGEGEDRREVQDW